MKKKKAIHCIKHFETRCLQRIGSVLDQNWLKAEMNSICSNIVRPLGRQSNTRSFWKLNYMDDDYVLIYDKLRHCFVTVLHYKEWAMERSYHE